MMKTSLCLMKTPTMRDGDIATDDKDLSMPDEDIAMHCYALATWESTGSPQSDE